MIIHPDFKELLQLLEKHDVDYMIVGGYAVAFHGYVRNTKDIDIFYRLSEANLIRLRNAMVEFGFSDDEINPADFGPGNIISFGVPPLRVDLLNSISGIDFDEAMPNRLSATYGDTPAKFISLPDLLKNKKATPRLQDKVDVEKLQ